MSMLPAFRSSGRQDRSALTAGLDALDLGPLEDRALLKRESEFMQAIRDYQRESGRMFPTWSEVLEVARNLGYMKSEGE